MRDASLIEVASVDRAERYRVEVLANACLCDDGIDYGDPEAAARLPWSAVSRVLAAEVGEPEGVLTVIFDLIVEAADADAGYLVRRFDADPGEDAMRVGDALLAALDPEVVTPSIKSLAAEGRPGVWYPDLEEFEAAALLSLAEG